MEISLVTGAWGAVAVDMLWADAKAPLCEQRWLFDNTDGPFVAFAFRAGHSGSDAGGSERH